MKQTMADSSRPWPSGNMGHILDIVPNHAGVGTNDNAWWNSVLEYGQKSPHAAHFDISWNGSPDAAHHGKLMLPLLGAPCDEVVKKRELKLTFDLATGGFGISYYDRHFPVSPSTYPLVLRTQSAELEKALGSAHAESKTFNDIVSRAADAHTPAAGKAVKQELAELVRRNSTTREHIEAVVRLFNASPTSANDPLAALIAAQHYRLAFWRLARDEINYRRFFDINDLAALAMERPEVFAAAHTMILDLLTSGKIDGVRIDHPDGLYDPKQYLHRLQQHAILAHAHAVLAEQPDRFAGVDSADLLSAVEHQLATSLPTVGDKPADLPVPVWVEKILALDEPLLPDWDTLGTSGYDFLNMANGLFVDSNSESAITDLYSRLTNGPTDFHQLVYEKKKLILRISLASELRMLTDLLQPLAADDERVRDCPLSDLSAILRELIACFPVYRAYASPEGVSETDQKQVNRAMAEAVKRNPQTPAAQFEFVRDLLLLQGPLARRPETGAAVQSFTGKFQQLTSPVTAKGIEDTSFYIFNRFVSLNEVGNEPNRFGIPPAELHRYLSDRQARWPYALSTLSTHDTKRSEDVRARLNVLSEMPDAWAEHASRWFAINAAHRKTLADKPAPDANEEFLLYQTLLGVWPIEGSSADVADRAAAYMAKAMREAKINTSWTDANADHESAVAAFIPAILDATSNAEFLADFQSFQKRVAWFGMINGLSQTLLKMTAPGVPDTYQGTDLWDLSLVDPDNRRPVDYALRRQLLAALEARYAAQDLQPLLGDLLATPGDGRIKLYATWRAMEARRRHPGLFSAGQYTPLTATGVAADHAFSFAREHAAESAIVVLPRLAARLGVAEGHWPIGPIWQETAIAVPASLIGRKLFNALTGEEITLAPSLAISTALARFPVGLWMSKI